MSLRADATSEIILLVLATGIFISPYFAKFTRIPLAPIEIIFGILCATFGFLPQNEIFTAVAKVGFYYLMFLAGSEIDVAKFFSIDKKILEFALIYLAFLYSASFIFAFLSDYAFLGFILLSLTSVGMLSTLFKEYGKDQNWLNAAMLAGVIGEIISIFMLTIAGSYLKFGNGVELYLSVNYLVLFVVLCVLGFRGLEVLFWWWPNLRVLLMPHYDKDEKDIRLSVALFFAVVATMIFLDIEIAFGAFIVGIFIATFFAHKKDLPHKLSSFGFGFLVPIFFIYIGSTLGADLEIITYKVFLDAFLLVILMSVIRVLGGLIFTNILGIHDSLLFGFSLSMPLTLLIAIATISHDAGIIPKELYFSLIIASLFEVILSMSAIKFVNYLKTRLKSVN